MTLMFSLWLIAQTQILMLQPDAFFEHAAKHDCVWSSAPDPAVGAYSVLQTPLADFKWERTEGGGSEGREGTKGMEGKLGLGH